MAVVVLVADVVTSTTKQEMHNSRNTDPNSISVSSSLVLVLVLGRIVINARATIVDAIRMGSGSQNELVCIDLVSTRGSIGLATYQSKIPAARVDTAGTFARFNQGSLEPWSRPQRVSLNLLFPFPVGGYIKNDLV